MHFQTGITVSKEAENDYVVSAVTWLALTSPPFATQKFTLPYIKDNLLAVGKLSLPPKYIPWFKVGSAVNVRQGINSKKVKKS